MFMRKIILKALLSPAVIVCICILAAATCFALSHPSLDLNGIAIGFGKGVTPSGTLVTRDYNITEKYSEIDVNRGIKLNYHVVSGTPKAIVTAPDNLIDNVIVTSRKGELKVTIDDDIRINGNANITVEAYGPAIDGIDASSAANITISSPLNIAGKLEIDASSAARIVLTSPVQAERIILDASSASRIECTEISCTKGEIDASSAAKIQTGKINGNSIQIESSSAASIKVPNCHLTELTANASSGASITISGEVDKADLGASSGASVGSKDLVVKSGVRKSASSGGSVRTK